MRLAPSGKTAGENMTLLEDAQKKIAANREAGSELQNMLTAERSQHEAYLVQKHEFTEALKRLPDHDAAKAAVALMAYIQKPASGAPLQIGLNKFTDQTQYSIEPAQTEWGLTIDDVQINAKVDDFANQHNERLIKVKIFLSMAGELKTEYTADIHDSFGRSRTSKIFVGLGPAGENVIDALFEDSRTEPRILAVENSLILTVGKIFDAIEKATDATKKLTETARRHVQP